MKARSGDKVCNVAGCSNRAKSMGRNSLGSQKFRSKCGKHRTIAKKLSLEVKAPA